MSIEQIRSLSYEKLRIKVAELCGWKLLPAKVGNYWIAPESYKTNLSGLPDFPTDLNAMHEAEKLLDARQQDAFAGFLGQLTGGRQIDFGAARINATTAILFATARQRCEAFVLTMEGNQ